MKFYILILTLFISPMTMALQPIYGEPTADFSAYLVKDTVSKMKHLKEMASEIHNDYGVYVDLGNLRYENLDDQDVAQAAYGQMILIRQGIEFTQKKDLLNVKGIKIRAFSSESCIKGDTIKLNNFDEFYFFPMATSVSDRSRSTGEGINIITSTQPPLRGVVGSLGGVLDLVSMPFRIGKAIGRKINRDWELTENNRNHTFMGLNQVSAGKVRDMIADYATNKKNAFNTCSIYSERISLVEGQPVDNSKRAEEDVSNRTVAESLDTKEETVISAKSDNK